MRSSEFSPFSRAVPSYRGYKKKAPLSLELFKRQRRNNLCGTTLVPEQKFRHSVSLYRADPASPTVISDRCSEGISGPVTLLPCTKRQLSEMWGRRDLSSSWRWGYYLLGV